VAILNVINRYVNKAPQIISEIEIGDRITIIGFRETVHSIGHLKIGDSYDVSMIRKCNPKAVCYKGCRANGITNGITIGVHYSNTLSAHITCDALYTNRLGKILE
jgi:hypothetical protein